MQNKTEIIYLESFKKHQFQEDVVKKLNVVLPFFLELDIVYIGITNDKSCFAQADVANNLVKFRADIPLKYVTTFHELMHLVAWQNDKTPKTEEYCSVYAMARMRWDLVDDEIPYIYHGDRELWQIPGICRLVVKYRESGHRDYLKFYSGLIGKYPERYLKEHFDLLDEEVKQTFGIL